VRFLRSPWSRRLREEPPAWPWREDDRPQAHRRWLRQPEPFEDRGAAEPYPGAMVLDDLAGDDDERTALRILARYTVVRLLLLAAGGLLPPTKLRTERRVAREHLALLPAHDWERHALERLCELARHSPPAELVDTAIVAAESAAKRGHGMGAFALYRAAYDIARDAGSWDAAARAAAGIERLAVLSEAPWSARLWRRRAAVLERRAARHADKQPGETP
jgi:hypothetical protein